MFAEPLGAEEADKSPEVRHFIIGKVFLYPLNDFGACLRVDQVGSAYLNR